MTTDPAAGSLPEAYIRTLRLALSFVFGVLRRNLLLIGGVLLLTAGAAYCRARLRRKNERPAHG